MISISSNNYFTIIRAAQIEAARLGMPIGDKQSVAAAVNQQEESRITAIAGVSQQAILSQIIDIKV